MSEEGLAAGSEIQGFKAITWWGDGSRSSEVRTQQRTEPWEPFRPGHGLRLEF